jgi:uncharacterized protein (DUF1800 family)
MFQQGVHVFEYSTKASKLVMYASLKTVVSACLLATLCACGSGGEGSSSGNEGGGGSPPDTAPDAPSNSQASAAKFLTQATFGPSFAEIQRLTKMSYAQWLAEQFAQPQALHRIYVSQADADRVANSLVASRNPQFFLDSFWGQAVTGKDQLRQRAAFALSQIFVVSFNESMLFQQPRSVASYYDMLGQHAFGNFRDLLEDVTLHPAMGVYLSHLKNQKEDAATGRVPDLNFAREITQLFTIGQYKLNLDASVVKDASGKPVAAYVPADLDGLSKVFTGWSWYAGTQPGDRTNKRFFGASANQERDWRPMQDYNQFAPDTNFHSISAKTFLGASIPAQTLTTADTRGDLKVALDTLFKHPNVGPFIGKQLIQRLVTSNPSPAYVARVATAFNDNGSGQRGDMKAVWTAILTDAEARNVAASTTAGKVREPVVRLANFLRAFQATSISGHYEGIGRTDDASTLAQAPMLAPSVFNFYRPGYVPSSKPIAAANLVAPELQIVDDVAVAGYMNYLQRWVVTSPATRDVQPDYQAELTLAASPADLVERMNLLLFYGQMPAALRAELVAAVTSRAIPAPVYPSPPAPAASAAPNPPVATNQAAIDAAKRDRVYLAVYMSMVAPDYLIQK